MSDTKFVGGNSWPRLSGTTTPDQSGIGSDGNEGVLHIP